MYCVMFMWKPGSYDDEFHRLNNLIDELARSLPGFLGAESWQAVGGTRRCACYYWTDLETLKVFSVHPTHLEAKRQICALVRRLPHRGHRGGPRLWRRPAGPHHGERRRGCGVSAWVHKSQAGGSVRWIFQDLVALASCCCWR